MAASQLASASISPLPDKVTPAIADRQDSQVPDRVHLTGWVGTRMALNESNRLANLDVDRLLEGLLTLARALAAQPTVLLADELSLGLAPLICVRLLAALRAAADRGAGVLLVEQRARDALAVADRAYVISGGQVVEAGVRPVQLIQLGRPHREHGAAHIRSGEADDVLAA